MEKKKILVMDDMEMNRLLIKSFLTQKGFEIDLAEDGLGGMEMLRKNQYACIFSDIEMPNMNGFEFLARIKRDESHNKIPVVILSSLKREEEIAKAKQLGASFYMVKPFTVEKMDEAFSQIGLK